MVKSTFDKRFLEEGLFSFCNGIGVHHPCSFLNCSELVKLCVSHRKTFVPTSVGGIKQLGFVYGSDALSHFVYLVVD